MVNQSMVHQGLQWIVTAHDLTLGVLLGLVLLLAVLYLKQRTDGRAAAEAENKRTPLEELQLRYVHGEINEEQYQHMRQELAHG